MQRGFLNAPVLARLLTTAVAIDYGGSADCAQPQRWFP